MTSNRPTSSQRFLEFDSEAEEPRGVPEPQRGQSELAAMKKTALDSYRSSSVQNGKDF